jgi:hypothetical protein
VASNREPVGHARDKVADGSQVLQLIRAALP